MTRRFTCRGFKGQLRKITYDHAPPLFVASVKVGPAWIEDQDNDAAKAKAKLGRKLDAVERALRERGRR